MPRTIPASRVCSSAPAPFAGHLPDFVMPDKLPGIGLTDRGLDVAGLPLLGVQIRRNGLIQKPTTILIKRSGQNIQRLNFSGIESKAYGLFFHNTYSQKKGL